MFLHSTNSTDTKPAESSAPPTHDYLSAVQNLLQSSNVVSIAVAFWGDGAQKEIAKACAGKPTRILCNLGSGGTNPKVISDLKKLHGVSIKTMDHLHAKVFIGDGAAIVGSANLSANGLGLEGERAKWMEAGYLVKEPGHHAEIQKWFDAIWADDQVSRPITAQMLKDATSQWLKQRSARPQVAKRFLDADLKNRNIYLAIYRMNASKETQEEMVQVNAEAAQLSAAEMVQQDAETVPSESTLLSNRKLNHFASWPDTLQEGDEALPLNAPIIMIKYSLNGQLTIVNVVRRIPQLDRVCLTNGEPMTIAGIESTVDGLEFNKADRLEFSKRIRPWVKSLFPDRALTAGRCLPLDAFLESGTEIHDH